MPYACLKLKPARKMNPVYNLSEIYLTLGSFRAVKLPRFDKQNCSKEKRNNVAPLVKENLRSYHRGQQQD